MHAGVLFGLCRDHRKGCAGYDLRPHGWQNPAHAALPGHVDQIAGLSVAKKNAIRTALSLLRQRREDADYRPGIVVNRAAARESWRDLTTILLLLT